MDAERRAARKFWRPKRPEAGSQCPSCPFRRDNDAEFAAILQRLRAKTGSKRKITKMDVARARYMVHTEDLALSGDFICHFTAYDADMNPKPPTEHRQCPGATRAYRGDDQETVNGNDRET